MCPRQPEKPARAEDQQCDGQDHPGAQVEDAHQGQCRPAAESGVRLAEHEEVVEPVQDGDHHDASARAQVDRGEHVAHEHREDHLHDHAGQRRVSQDVDRVEQPEHRRRQHERRADAHSPGKARDEEATEHPLLGEADHHGGQEDGGDHDPAPVEAVHQRVDHACRVQKQNRYDDPQRARRPPAPGPGHGDVVPPDEPVRIEKREDQERGLVEEVAHGAVVVGVREPARSHDDEIAGGEQQGGDDPGRPGLGVRHGRGVVRPHRPAEDPSLRAG